MFKKLLEKLFKHNDKRKSTKVDLDALGKEVDETTEYLLKCNEELTKKLEQAQKA